MGNPLSQKQIDSYTGSTARLNFWEGAVRSGKTFISIVRFMKALKEGPSGLAMIIGGSRDSIQRNILSELCSLVGAPVPTPKATQLNLFGRTIFLVGANDERAQRRIQGSTLAMAYVDELTLIPQGFFRMLLSRLSVTGAQLFGTTNPDSPFHWLKVDFLNKTNLDMKVFRFRLPDNPSLSKAYIDSLKNEYTGLWYKRYIDGDWCLAEGCVYDFYDEDINQIDIPPGPAEYFIIGIDYGTINPTAFTMVGYNSKYWPNIWLEKEYYFSSKDHSRQKTDTEIVEDLKRFIGDKQVRCVYVDPSAASLKIEMMREGISGVLDADNSVLDGIRFLSKTMSNGTLKICSNCTNTIREFQTYRWDEKVSAKGEDKPLKEHDHCFVAGTKIITEHGELPIEEVQPGFKVLTSNGWNKVKQRFEHEAEVAEFDILGKKTICTPSHKFLTNNGWKECASLTLCDMLFINIGELEWLKSSSLKRENTDVIPILSTLISDDTSKRIAGIAATDLDISIETFGSHTMEKYKKTVIFITKTGTHSTIALATSNAFQLQNIYPNTKEILQRVKEKLLESIVPELDLLQKNGTGVKRGEYGTKTTQKTVLGKQSKENSNVIIAGKSTKPQNQKVRDFVQVTVSRSGEEIVTWIMRKEYVFIALEHLSQTNTQSLNSAQSLARVNIAGETDVYNLHVENHHEFFANGVLVSNCLDSLRYAIYTHFKGKLGNSEAEKEVDKIYADVCGVQSDLPGFFRDTKHDPLHAPQMPAVGGF